MTHDVVIAGGGPNGLMLACELRLAGVGVVVLERRSERSGPNRAQALAGRVVHLFDYRGVFSWLSDGMAAPVPTPFFNFAGLPMDLRDLGAHPLCILPIPQSRLEEKLEERARELGAEVRRGHELTDLLQDDAGVIVEARGPDGNYQLRASYLVGCDGAGSTVRKRAGIGFPDTGDQDIVSRGGDVVLPPSIVGGNPKPTGLLQHTSWLELPGVGRVPFGFTRTATGFFAIGSFLPGIHILGTTEWGRSTVDAETPMTVAELRESVRRVLGVDVPMSAPSTPGEYRLYRLTGNNRQAERYRIGRVLLAGDAAHIHAAMNAPGLNLGLQDVVNLSWKLAGAVHGWAPPELLDTYETERHPVGERVLMQSQSQTALMAPGTDVTALRAMFTEMLEQQSNRRYIAELMAGADIRYDMGAGDETRHPLLGRWAPDFALATAGGATRLAELMHAARPVLLDLTGGSRLAEVAMGWKDRVDVVAAQPADQSPPASALLIRPDCHVAWASDSQDVDQQSCDGLRAALTTWFGSPA